MGKFEDLTGRFFGGGRLKVLHKAPSGRRIRWVCQCGCGNICVVRGDFLKSGVVRSCGCAVKDKQEDKMSEREMRAFSRSLNALLCNVSEPYQNLANAIIAVAADDYRLALRNADEGMLKSLDRFFHSEWYGILTDVDADRLLGMLRKEQSGLLKAAYI